MKTKLTKEIHGFQNWGKGTEQWKSRDKKVKNTISW